MKKVFSFALLSFLLILGSGLPAFGRPEQVPRGLQKLVADYEEKRLKTYGAPATRPDAPLLTVEKTSFTSPEQHTAIQVRFIEPQGFTFVFQYDDFALKNPEVMLKDIGVLGAMSFSAYNVFSIPPSKDHIPFSPMAYAELLTNAQDGSPTAKARLKEIEYNMTTDGGLGIATQWMAKAFEIPKEKLDAYVLQHTENLQKELPRLQTEASQYEKRRQKLYAEWKKNGELERLESLDEKLNDLILKNDRAGVRKMLQAYLPWPLMEPVETEYWKTWLEAIEHPDWKNTTTAFRGVDYSTDKVQRLKMPDGTERLGFMSTVLTKNQGSYTRRLRSLTTSRELNGDRLNLQNSFLSVKMNDMFYMHAREAKTSQFLSFTASLHVINFFAGGTHLIPSDGGFLAVKMDSRRMMPNLVSKISSEMEFLAPLIVFPDEVLVYTEQKRGDEGRYQAFLEALQQKTGVDYESKESKRAEYLKFRANGTRLFRQMIEAVQRHGAQNLCSKIW